jgi:hypothetical protein
VNNDIAGLLDWENATEKASSLQSDVADRFGVEKCIPPEAM